MLPTLPSLSTPLAILGVRLDGFMMDRPPGAPVARCRYHRGVLS